MIPPFVKKTDALKYTVNMKPALSLTMIYLASAALSPAQAQEHVDVPLPPYDPPPTVSHHGENHDDQSVHTSRNDHSQRQALKGGRRTKSSHADPPDHRNHHRHRKHGHFHWPWQHSN